MAENRKHPDKCRMDMKPGRENRTTENDASRDKTNVSTVNRGGAAEDDASRNNATENNMIGKRYEDGLHTQYVNAEIDDGS